MNRNNRPDYTIGAMNTATGARNPNIGAAWKNPDGSLTLRLDVGCTIVRDGVHVYRLFPQTHKARHQSCDPLERAWDEEYLR